MVFKFKIKRETPDIRTVQPIITNSIILLNTQTRGFVQNAVPHTCSNDSTRLTDDHVSKHNFSSNINKKYTWRKIKVVGSLPWFA